MYLSNICDHSFDYLSSQFSAISGTVVQWLYPPASWNIHCCAEMHISWLMSSLLNKTLNHLLGQFIGRVWHSFGFLASCPVCVIFRSALQWTLWGHLCVQWHNRTWQGSCKWNIKASSKSFFLNGILTASLKSLLEKAYRHSCRPLLISESGRVVYTRTSASSLCTKKLFWNITFSC